MISVTMTSQVKAGYKDKISPKAMIEWLSRIPENATLTPIFEERGDQRDSYKVFAGLHATWVESR